MRNAWLLGTVAGLLISAVPFHPDPSRPVKHWHEGPAHGIMNGKHLNAADCEELFGGDGW